MSTMKELEEKLALATKRYYEIHNNKAEQVFSQKLRTRERAEKKFMRIWKKYRQNKTQYQKEFLDISVLLGVGREKFDVYRSQLEEKAEPYEKEIKDITKKIRCLEDQEWNTKLVKFY